ncbi:MAG: ABC transporter permease [Actinobacteria bacterium]|nr:ABC transporter permease [Actinomycetota bacterium]OPZ77654.1 MAG: putative D,D-dipeptide transport system permease protein DdpC [Actinobacteria bacterium ADurb.Bin444]
MKKARLWLSRIWSASPLAVVGMIILLAWLFVMIFAKQIAINDGIVQDLVQRFKPPSWQHPFGTDGLGRDILSRVVFGSHISIPVAFMVVGVSLLLGGLVGLVAGYFGKAVDEILMRICDLVLSFPGIILALAIAAALGPSLTHSLIAVVAVSWPIYARLMRSLVISMRSSEYVDAVVAQGARVPRILMGTVIPNTISAVFIMATLDLGNAMLTFAGLSFLGLGQAPPTPEWGAMVSVGAQDFTKWWVALFPGLAIVSFALAWNFIGDALRDLMDPSLRRLL